MRVPLVVSFFATEDRINALKSTTLRQLLDSVVFEPYKYDPSPSLDARTELPGGHP
jgi:hypothetical protein